MKSSAGSGTAHSRYKAARTMLLVMNLFTAFNVLFYLFGGSTKLLFSFDLPYFAMVILAVGGMPVVGLAAALILLCVCTGFYVFSKHYVGFFVAATVFLAVDTLFMAGLYAASGDASGLLDGIVHVFLLVMFIRGLIAYRTKTDITDEETNDA